MTVSQPKRLIKAIRATLWDESGATVRKKSGNSRWSLSAGDVDPKDTYTNTEGNISKTFQRVDLSGADSYMNGVALIGVFVVYSVFMGI